MTMMNDLTDLWHCEKCGFECGSDEITALDGVCPSCEGRLVEGPAPEDTDGTREEWKPEGV